MAVQAPNELENDEGLTFISIQAILLSQRAIAAVVAL